MPDARDLSNRAVELAESGQNDEALALVNKAIKLYANNANSWYNKGMALMCSGKNLEAIRAFNKLLKIHPHDERAREQVDLAQRRIMESGSSSQSSPSKDQMKLIK